MPTTWLGVDEPATIDFRLGCESIGYGTTNLLAEHMVVVGTASNQFLQFSTAGAASNTMAPVVRVIGQPDLTNVYQGSTILTPQYSSIQVTASGIASIVASAAGAIYVMSVQLAAKSSCTIQWMEATTSGLTGVQALGADGGFVLNHNPHGWFKTSSGKQLSLSVQGSSGGVGGSLTWVRPAS